MNHSSFLLLLQSFLGKSQQLIFSGFDGGSPTFGFGIGHTEKALRVEKSLKAQVFSSRTTLVVTSENCQDA